MGFAWIMKSTKLGLLSASFMVCTTAGFDSMAATSSSLGGAPICAIEEVRQPGPPKRKSRDRVDEGVLTPPSAPNMSALGRLACPANRAPVRPARMLFAEVPAAMFWGTAGWAGPDEEAALEAAL